MKKIVPWRWECSYCLKDTGSVCYVCTFSELDDNESVEEKLDREWELFD